MVWIASHRALLVDSQLHFEIFFLVILAELKIISVILDGVFLYHAFEPGRLFAAELTFADFCYFLYSVVVIAFEVHRFLGVE